MDLGAGSELLHTDPIWINAYINRKNDHETSIMTTI